MTGFHVDPVALDALALRLEDTADEYRAAAAALEAPEAPGRLGPAPVSAALTVLTGAWSGSIRAVQTDFADAAAGVRAAATAYRATDAAAAEELGRADG